MATILNVYSLYDEKAEAFVCPMYNTKDGLCVRELKGIVSNPQSPIHKSLDDFKLYQVATFDEATGQYCSLDVPKFIVDVNTLVEV